MDFVVERDTDPSRSETGSGWNLALEYPTSGTTGFAIMSQFVETAGAWVSLLLTGGRLWSQTLQSVGGNIGVGTVVVR